MSHVAEMLVGQAQLRFSVGPDNRKLKDKQGYWVSDAALVLTPWLSQMLTFSNSLLDMSGQSQIFQINNKQTSVLITETLSKFVDANIGANRLNSRQQYPLSPPPFPSLRLNCILVSIVFTVLAVSN